MQIDNKWTTEISSGLSVDIRFPHSIKQTSNLNDNF